MKTLAANPQTAKDFMQLLGLKFDESARRGIRFEFKQNNFEIDGFRFPSDVESKRYIELKLKALRGEIEGLQIGAKVGVCYKLNDGETYRPTFVYFNKRGELVLEDCRKMQSKDNLRKIEMVKIQYGITIKVINQQ